MTQDGPGDGSLIFHLFGGMSPFLDFVNWLSNRGVTHGANGFEPSTSWSRTSLDQTKSVELTAFACAFPPLIWATWATKMPSDLRSTN